jgi:hypothetical protein
VAKDAIMEPALTVLVETVTKTRIVKETKDVCITNVLLLLGHVVHLIGIVIVAKDAIVVPALTVDVQLIRIVIVAKNAIMVPALTIA